DQAVAAARPEALVVAQAQRRVPAQPGLRPDPEHAARTGGLQARQRRPGVHADEAGLQVEAAGGERFLPFAVAVQRHAAPVALHAQAGDGLAAARLPGSGAQAEALGAAFAEAVAAQRHVLGAQVGRQRHAARPEAPARFHAGMGVVAGVAAGHAEHVRAQLQAALDVALEAAGAGLAQQVGLATGPSRIGGGRGLALVRAVAQALDAAVRTHLA